MKIFPSFSLKKLTFAPMAPHNLGLIEMTLMVFLFTFSYEFEEGHNAG